MPKPHKPEAYISVSPWMSKEANRSQDDQNEQRYYTVVEEDLIAHSNTHKQDKIHTTIEKKCTEPTQPHLVSEWHMAGISSAKANTTQRHQQYTEIDGENDDFEIDIVEYPTDHPTSTLSMHGTATLLLKESFHPNNEALQTTIVGMLDIPLSNIPWINIHTSSIDDGTCDTLQYNSSTTNNAQGSVQREARLRFPVHGKGITSYRECTRDAEWSTVKLHIYGIPLSIPQHDRNDTSSEMSVITERTGGDAMRLHGPVEWHGSETEMVSDLMNECTPNVVFDFECHTLLTGKDAALRLMDGMSLLGNSMCIDDDVILNVGECTIQWTAEEPSSDDDG